MPNFITIPNDNDPVMNSERARIVPWAPTSGWIYVGYNNESDHLAQIAHVSNGQQLDVFDFDCHGNPTVFDHTDINSVSTFGRNLSRVTGFSANTRVYLDACNTGLPSAFGGPIAQVLANAAKCPVYGTKGYMTGTYAEGNEHCYASPSGLTPYPGAQDAIGRTVWIAFQPRTVTTSEVNVPITLQLTAGVKASAEVLGMVEGIMAAKPVDFPKFRMAPDATINYRKGQSLLILDIYANGSLLKNRISGEAWHVDNPARFQSLVATHLR